MRTGLSTQRAVRAQGSMRRGLYMLYTNGCVGEVITSVRDVRSMICPVGKVTYSFCPSNLAQSV